jgi:glycosyltransferase involved in cell wall biosynthesis
MNKKQIVFVNQSSGYLMIDIVHAFEEEYDERILMTGVINSRNKKLDESVKVEKLIKYKRSSAIYRVFTWIYAFLKVLFMLKTKYRKAHLFLVSNPPLTVFLPKFCSNTFSILVYDVYPDALIEFKVFNSNSYIIKYWKKINRQVFSNAKKIYTITDGMKEKLGQYVDMKKISVISVWTDNDFLKPISKNDNQFLKEQKLEDKFIIMYSGNLGKSHPIEVLIDIAEAVKEEISIFFLIIGGGDKYEFLKEKIKNSTLDNIRLLEWQPTEMLPYTLSGADLGVVSLGNEVSDLSIPSKTYNLMSVGVPILCLANENSALAKLIAHHNNGKAFDHLQIEAITNFILKCNREPLYLDEMKKNSLAASNCYTPENAKLFVDV